MAAARVPRGLSLALSWFPGHMAKAQARLAEKLPKCDAVLEICDARLPVSSRNPVLDELIGNRPRLVVLNKADLAPARSVEAWLRHIADTSSAALGVCAKEESSLLEVSRSRGRAPGRWRPGASSPRTAAAPPSPRAAAAPRRCAVLLRVPVPRRRLDGGGGGGAQRRQELHH